MKTNGGPMLDAPGSGARHKRRGFTLLELSVVLAVTAVVAAITLPRLQAMQQQTQSEQELHDFVTFMHRVSDLARSRQEVMCVVYSGGPGAYQFAVTPLGPLALDAGCEQRNLWDGTIVLSQSFSQLNSVTFNHLIPSGTLPTVAILTPPGSLSGFDLAWATTRFGEPGGCAGWAKPDWLWGLTAPSGFPQPPLQVTVTALSGESARITQYNAGVFDVQE